MANHDAVATERTAAELAGAYLAALQAKDKAAIFALVSDDFVLEVPLNCSGTNDGSDNWCGHDAASTGWDMAFRTIADLIYVDVEISPGADPGVAFLEGRGAMRMANGRTYRNAYIFRFDTKGGRITRIREYANPVTGALAWGMPLPTPEPI